MMGTNQAKKNTAPSIIAIRIAKSECRRNIATQTQSIKMPKTIADFPKSPLPSLMTPTISLTI